MKGTDHFKKTILMYLEQRAEEDQLFAKSFSNPAKNIDDCVTYILNYVKNSGCNGFTDGEIFGQAIHYYEENLSLIHISLCPAVSDFLGKLAVVLLKQL